ncbi:MAG: alpha/beta hydrolase [Clostridiales bacterium]|jgi:pimeloyl-ACP methyl ester carboxylesterase|nr:alpha/beta hydrolase [Clostridiales bacterium]
MISNIKRKEINTSRLKVSYIEKGDTSKDLLILVHGNTSSNIFYLRNIEELSCDFHVIAPDLRGYGFSEKLPIDAVQGLKVWSEDLRSFLKALGISKKPHLLGWSMGGGVVMQYAIDYPEDVASLTLVNPLSPFGYSGTKDEKGTRNNEFYSGTGGGTVNQAFVQALRDKLRDSSNPFSATSVLKSYFAPDYKIDPEWEEIFVDSMLQMGIGDDFYPGNYIPCSEWPFTAPGDKGIGNAMSPKYVNLSSITDINPKPPILWFRGAKDAIVSDTCMLDIGYLGKLGYVQGWPGDEIFPPHPMVTQTRFILEKYMQNGGTYEEFVFEDAGHGPNVEKPKEFNEKLVSFIKNTK